MRARALVLALTACFVAAPVAAAGEQLDARTDPAVTGPVTQQGKQCKHDEQVYEGEIVARARICLYVYAYDPAQDADPLNDYGIIWAQSNVDTRSGWCAIKAHTDVVLPTELTVLSRSPKPQTIEKPREATIDLATTGANNAGKAKLSATMTLYPNELDRRMREDESAEANAVRVTWRGLEEEKLAFASGIEVSWAQGSELPALSYAIRYPIKKTTCRSTSTTP